MQRRGLFAGLGLAAAALIVVGVALAAGPVFHEAHPGEFDPGKTNLVNAAWLSGIGCPTAVTLSDGSTYNDSGCPTGDSKDKKNEGLLLAKTGPTSNNASSFAVLKDVPSTVSELGYDIRKAGAPGSATGSHCGAGAPRFNIVTTTGTFFIGCNSPPGTPTAASNGWTRLRWTGLTFTDVKEIDVLFDEGQDTGPDNFGAAILDNIDVNTTLVGQGAVTAN